MATTRKFAEAGLLQGLLSTPNALTNVEDFVALCEFAVELGAKYVLMNPLSSFGRGTKSQGRLAADNTKMNAIRDATDRFRSMHGEGLEDAHMYREPGSQPHSWIGRTGDGYRYDYVHVGAALATRLRHSAYLHETRQQVDEAHEPRLTDHAAVEVKLDLAATRLPCSPLTGGDEPLSLF